MTVKQLIQKLSEYPDDNSVGIDVDGWWLELTPDNICGPASALANWVTLAAIDDDGLLTSEEYANAVED